MSAYSVIIFETTHDAIRAEKTLKQELPVMLMPTPRRFSQSCGIALRFASDITSQIKNLLQQYSLQGTIHELPDVP